MSEQHQSYTHKEVAKEQDLYVQTAHAQADFRKSFIQWQEDKAGSEDVIAKGQHLMDLQEQLQKNGGPLSPMSVMHRVEVVKDSVAKGKVKPTQKATDQWTKRVAEARHLLKALGSKK